MKRFALLFVLLFAGQLAFSQFGTFEKKEDIETFKDSRLVVVLFPDSPYSAAIQAAIERYWTFTGFEFAPDTAMQRYRKGNFTFLVFSKSKGSKNKSKLASSEEDFNGLVITKKFSRRIVRENLLAYAFCKNNIDTTDWESEMTKGVQLLNNYCNYAIQAKDDRDMKESYMMSHYPSDKHLLLDKKLLIEDKQLELKGKEEAPTLFDGDAEEVDAEEIQRAIKWQDDGFVYFYYSKDIKTCNKLVLTSNNSELMYFTSVSPEKCKCNAKDLEKLREIKADVNK